MKTYFLFFGLLSMGSLFANNSLDGNIIENIKIAIMDCDYDSVSQFLDEITLSKKQHSKILIFAKAMRRNVVGSSVDTGRTTFGILGLIGLAACAPTIDFHLDKLANIIHSHQPIITYGSQGVYVRSYENKNFNILINITRDILTSNVYTNENLHIIPTKKIADFIRSDIGKIIIASPIIFFFGHALYKGLTGNPKIIRRRKMQDLEAIIELIESVNPERFF